MKKLNLWDFVIKGNANYVNKSITNLLYKDGFVYGTDGKVLIKIKSDYAEEMEGKIIDRKGKLSDGVNFPNCEKVIPDSDEVGFVNKGYVFLKDYKAMDLLWKVRRLSSWDGGYLTYTMTYSGRANTNEELNETVYFASRIADRFFKFVKVYPDCNVGLYKRRDGFYQVYAHDVESDAVFTGASVDERFWTDYARSLVMKNNFCFKNAIEDYGKLSMGDLFEVFGKKEVLVRYNQNKATENDIKIIRGLEFFKGLLIR